MLEVRILSGAPSYSSLAQLVEQHLDTVKVTSSNLVGTTIIRPLVKWISSLSSKQRVGVRSSQGRPINLLYSELPERPNGAAWKADGSRERALGFESLTHCHKQAHR